MLLLLYCIVTNFMRISGIIHFVHFDEQHQFIYTVDHRYFANFSIVRTNEIIQNPIEQSKDVKYQIETDWKISTVSIKFEYSFRRKIVILLFIYIDIFLLTVHFKPLVNPKPIDRIPFLAKKNLTKDGQLFLRSNQRFDIVIAFIFYKCIDYCKN